MALKLQFDNTLSYQQDAVQQVIDLFEWQPIMGAEFQLGTTGMFDSELWVGNYLSLSQDAIFENLQKIQERFNTQKVNSKTLGIETDSQWFGTIPVSKQLEWMHFSVEMETWTGKTYVYLKTIYELYKTYGFKKFIIVVPSIAIKEGTLKNLQITTEHFGKEYDIKTMKYFVYDSKKPNILRDFAVSNDLRIMIMNIDAFNKKEANKIYQNLDSMNGIRPIDLIKWTKPILIVDEPQNMESDKSKSAMSELNYSFTLRYSATHKELYNQIYRLTPIDAYDMWLVKKIEVNSIVTGENNNQAYIELVKVSATASNIKATIIIDIEDKEWIKRKKIPVQVNDDLYNLSNSREDYKDGYYVTAIDPTPGYESIEFTNGVQLTLNKSNDTMKEELIKTQIWETVREHFEKEKKLHGKWIKVLTLFFLDKVANYRIHTDAWFDIGPYAKMFEEAYIEISKKQQYQWILEYTAQEVHNGYFSQDKKWNLKDTKWDSSDDDDTYNLIMKDKEKLLDINTPLRFIFSHSALREWRDNPNVFQICTLNESQSTMKKRQEIWRWLRLPVDQNGQRVFDPFVNKLTVIANESYDTFCKTLQKEIRDETGIDFWNRIKNANKKTYAKLKKEVMLHDDNFKELWNKIKQKTKYSVQFDTAKLIKDTSEKIKDMKKIIPPKITAEKVGIDMTYEGITWNLLTNRVYVNTAKDLPVPDVLSWLQSKTFLTKTTILEILKKSGRIRDILINPQMFLDAALKEIRSVLAELMVDGIEYEKIEWEYYEMRLFEDEDIVGYLQDNMFPVNKSIYDHVVIDSQIESKFAKDLDSMEQVKFFLKLPNWFKIETPIGTYNPDWAIVFEDDKKIYFVAETKWQTNLDLLRWSEEKKILCGKKHFETLGWIEYKVVREVRELIK